MFYLCRHGETKWTKTGQHTSVTDISLTEEGKKQAELLGKRLKGIHFVRVISSPMERTIETCRLAGLEPEINPDAAEWNYGKYEGLTTEEIGEKWNLFRDGAPGGESVEQVGKRADRLLKSLKDDPVIIFSHGHFSRVLAARWLGLPVSAGALFYLSVASISILGLEHGRPVIRLWNET